MTLEDILQKHCGCKGSAFLKRPRRDADGNTEYFTKQGAAAYGTLTALIEDLGELGVLDGAAEDIIETLDDIVREG